MSPAKTTSMQSPLDGLQCPKCEAVDINWKEDTYRTVQCPTCATAIATFHQSDLRFDWQEIVTDAELRKRVDTEVKKYDHWAEQRLDKQELRSTIRSLDDWFGCSKAMETVQQRWPDLSRFNGKRVLDIGGSCLDSWRFVAAGAQRIDQIEVSPASQQLGKKRLELELSEHIDVQWRERICFHTTPAENLPFAPDTFDLVFSRSTIHHTLRPDSFIEIHRALKPGGLMFILEPRFNKVMYRVMQLSRLLRGAERGTDDPLQTREIRELGSLFRAVDWYPSRFIKYIWSQSLGRFIDAPTIEDKMTQLENRLGNFFGLGYLTGSYCWVVAQK